MYYYNILGTPEHNTVCTMCENGTFSPNVSLTAKCLPCSTCDGERKVHKACNGKTDVICTSHGEWVIQIYVTSCSMFDGLKCNSSIYMLDFSSSKYYNWELRW